MAALESGLLYMRDWKLDVINFCASFALDLRTQDKFGNEADIVDHVTFFYSRRIPAAVLRESFPICTGGEFHCSVSSYLG